MENEKLEKFNEMIKEAFTNYDHQRKIDVCDYFNKTNGGDMENKKVIINNDMQDFVMVCSAIRQLDDAVKRLRDIEEFSKDKLLVDIAEYTAEDVIKILKQLEGYLNDNYELV